VRTGAVAQAIELVVLSVWLGGALLVATAVAPAAFAVLPSRTLAGALVGRVLPVVFISGIAAAIVAVLCEMNVSRNAFSLKVSAPLIGLAAGCAIAQFVVAPKIDRIRAAVTGPIDSLAPTDPQRVAFGKLHVMSVLWLGIAMLGASVAIGIQIYRTNHPVILSAAKDPSRSLP
jgi:hypothetical protein